VPASAQAYSLNATVVPSAPLGYLTLWPSGQPQPFVSTLNSLDGRVVANAAIVPAGGTGAVNAFVTGSTDLIFDTNGYFGAVGNTEPLLFFPITPCRVADTRNADGPFGGPSIPGGEARSFAIRQSSCGVTDTARAYALNVTAVPHGESQYLTIWPADQPQPLVSTLNSFQGGVVANAAIVPAAADGAIKVFTSATADVVLDINGYFAPAEGTTPQDPPDYLLSVTPLSRTITGGESATYEVRLTSRNGFAGQVLVILLNPPNNLSGATFDRDTLTLAPNGTDTTTLTLVSKPSGPFGTATMTVRALSAGLPAKAQDITLTVNPPVLQGAEVSIRQFQFSPTPVTVAPGARVTWTNMDAGVSHTVVADGGQFASGVLGNGQSFVTMPTTPGTYNYHCSIHPFMTGTVIVQ
jgi:plastocyanin